jgi:hypothetical protein
MTFSGVGVHWHRGECDACSGTALWQVTQSSGLSEFHGPLLWME